MQTPEHAIRRATVGCAFASDESAVAALQAVSAAGIDVAWRMGATDATRADRIGGLIGAPADLDPNDPLTGVSGLASGADAASGVNSGAAAGGVAGAVAGLLIGATPLGSIMPVDPSLRRLAATLLFFAVGVAVGGVFGGAFGKRSSTHAGFRLIDAMEAGDLAAVGSMDPARTDDARRVLEEHGAREVIVIR